ncbi:hypothetical protein B6D60_09420 [candidate division KSB1 bacterium 4484_87]|nr:MAG: hypothetical protein B6D60_09420 [candidate division KSB1 bacterium 4484_87]
MEKFIKFKDHVTVKDLVKVLKDDRIIILRFSQMTETVQVQILSHLSDQDIRKAFHPYEIEKIYREYPYPLRHGKAIFQPIRSFFSIFKRIFAFAR